MSITKVACFSVAAMDYFSRQERYFAGGNALNQAAHFNGFDKFESAFVGALGKDSFGDKILALLKSNNIDISHLYRVEGVTANNEIINDNLGERFGVDGCWKGGVYDGFVLSDDDWVFLSGFDIWSTHASCPNFKTTLTKVGRDNFLAVDFLHCVDKDTLDNCLPYIDVAFVGGSTEMKNEVQELSYVHKSLIVLTMGGEGSVAYVSGESSVQDALHVDTVVDTTGCGDAFQAAFTAKYYETKDVKAALSAGAQNGRRTTQHFGGTAWNDECT